jgi:simple sugar transport system substrate-binding protein
VSDGSQINKLVVIAVITLILGTAIGYGLTSLTMVSTSEYTELQTAYNELQASSVSLIDYNDLQSEYDYLLTLIPKTSVKAGFIYVGPIGDFGWTHAHDQGRLYIDQKYPWLETVYFESVAEADCERFIDRLITEEQCDIVFTTSFGFMDPTITSGEKYSDKVFFHCSGFLRSKNVGTYFADFYQLYYLNGLMAGALTKTGKVGYVGAVPIPEVVRHINAFTLGVREVNPEATVSVRWIYSWYDPTSAREAAEALIAEGCDALAFTEDSPTVLQVGQEHTLDGNQIYTFSHYSPMQTFAPDSCVSGQLVHWETLYEDIIVRYYLGVHNSTNLSNVDYLYNLRLGGAELGGEFGVPINPAFVSELKSIMVDDPILGEEDVYDLVMDRLNQMSAPLVSFDPFSGPIKDQEGVVRIPEGAQGTYADLWTIDWFVEGVIGTVG